MLNRDPIPPAVVFSVGDNCPIGNSFNWGAHARSNINTIVRRAAVSSSFVAAAGIFSTAITLRYSARNGWPLKELCPPLGQRIGLNAHDIKAALNNLGLQFQQFRKEKGPFSFSFRQKLLVGGFLVLCLFKK